MSCGLRAETAAYACAYRRHLGESIKLEHLARVANFSSFHLHRLFLAHLGETIGSYQSYIISKKRADLSTRWRTAWIDSVAEGGNAMSAGEIASNESRGGGFKAISSLAKRRKVHLVRLTDDNGVELVAASIHPFTVLA
jgi:AraC-like DNA-binding protein